MWSKDYLTAYSVIQSFEFELMTSIVWPHMKAAIRVYHLWTGSYLTASDAEREENRWEPYTQISHLHLYGDRLRTRDHSGDEGKPLGTSAPCAIGKAI